MATAVVGIDIKNRTGSNFFDDVAVSEYRVRYKITSATTDGQVEVLATTGLPTLWDAFPADASAIVRRREATVADDARTLWYVDVFYSSKAPEGEGQDPSGDPGALPQDLAPQITWHGETEMVPATTDAVTLVPIVNGAGLPFINPPAMRPQKITVVTWSRYQVAFGGAAEIEAWQGKVNVAAWNGYPVETVLIDRIEARTEFINGALYFYVTDVLKYRSDKWNLLLPNISTHVKNPTTGELERYPTKEGSPAIGHIDAAGAAVSTPGSPLEFSIYPTTNFTPRYGP